MIGVDIVKIDRIKKAAERGDSFMRIFTPAEIEYINTKKNPYQTMAGIFAAKEAVVKALGEGFNQTHPSKIEVFWQAGGKPSARINEKVLDISISHDGDYAIAVALIKKE